MTPRPPAAVFSPYANYSRAEWARLRDETPMPLSEAEIENLSGLTERVSEEEVVDIYLPLSQLLNFYVEASQELHGETEKFLGKGECKVPFIVGLAGSVAAGKSTTARVLQALLASETASTVESLTKVLRTGKTGDAMPASLTNLVKRCAEINAGAFGRATAWRQQADLAAKVKALAAARPKALAVDAAIAPYDWAVAIALPVVRDSTDATAVQRAVTVITAVRDGYLKLKAPAGPQRALAINTQLFAAAARQKAHRDSAAWTQTGILDTIARFTFDKNAKDGLGTKNATGGGKQSTISLLGRDEVALDGPVSGGLAIRLEVDPGLGAGEENP